MGKSGKVDPKVTTLINAGFSKTKAVEALRDAGNNVHKARELLERRRQAAQPPVAPPSAAPRGASSSAVDETEAAEAASQEQEPSRKSKVSLLEAAEAKRPTPQQQWARRTHPCICQHKTCWFGEYCRFRDLPGDVCLHYLMSFCQFGGKCALRHAVDGVDVKDLCRALNEGEDGEGEGEETWGAEREDGEEWYGGDGGDTDAAYPHISGQLSAEAPPFVPSFLKAPEPAVVETPAAEGAPSPFLEAARRSKRLAKTGQKGHTASGGTAASAFPQPFGAPSRRRPKKHPCIAQKGSCMFGARCEHADRDADVCVYFLNGVCRYSAEECPLRHETLQEHLDKLQARLAGGDGDTSGEDSETRDREPAAAAAAAEARDGRPQEDEEEAQEAQESLESSAAAESSEEAEEKSEEGRRAGGMEEEESEEAPEPELSDAQVEKLLSLTSALPGVDVALAAQALRAADWCEEEAAALVRAAALPEVASDCLSVRRDEELARALAAEEAEEAAEAAALGSDGRAHRARQAESRSEAYLTLCALFPTVPAGSVSDVLRQNRYDIDDAYSMLLCSQSALTRAQLAAPWRGELSAADQLRLRELEAQYPSLSPELVRCTYGVCGRSSAATATALNEMCSSIITQEEAAEERRAAAERQRRQAAAAQQQQQLKAAAAARRRAAAAASPARRFQTAAEAREELARAEAEMGRHGDWRSVRQQAYATNELRVRVASQAAAAFHRRDNSTGHQLAAEAVRLGGEYARLNRLAMLALERERLGGAASSVLDLHYFHASEVAEVLYRRVALCRRVGARQLTVVFGKGLHSRGDQPKLGPAVVEALRTDPFLSATTKIVARREDLVKVSIKPRDVGQ